MSTDTSPAISIIMPVYKAEAYLRRSICSLLTQTFSDFELLLIDDGSPDRSGEICDEFARKDPRIRVVHQANSGVAAARQCGLDHARGEYVIHADPDDWAEPDMLEELYGKAKENGCDTDIVICDFYVNFGKKQIYKKQKPSALDSKTIQRELFQQLHGSCCNKLVKRACYRENNVKFPEKISFKEDLIFNIRLLQHAKNIRYLPKAFYHYEQNINALSLCHNHSIEQDIKVRDLLCCELPSNIRETALPALAYGIVYNAFQNHTHTSQEFREIYGKERVEMFKAHRPIIIRVLLAMACYGMQWLAYPIFTIIQQEKNRRRQRISLQ